MARPKIDFNILENNMPYLDDFRHVDMLGMVRTHQTTLDNLNASESPLNVPQGISDNNQYSHYLQIAFVTAQKFLNTHKQPRTDNDWANILQALHCSDNNVNPLAKDLIQACLAELEREYLQNT